jgi:hypothetical protein
MEMSQACASYSNPGTYYEKVSQITNFSRTPKAINAKYRQICDTYKKLKKQFLSRKTQHGADRLNMFLSKDLSWGVNTHTIPTEIVTLKGSDSSVLSSKISITRDSDARYCSYIIICCQW